MLKIYAVSIIATILGLFGSWYYAGLQGFVITIILSILEISLSFDNAIVNATVLSTMDKVWQQRFLTWGILIAVFGMRLVFPIALVAAATDLNFLEVINLSLKDPDNYATHLTSAHVNIAAFGGMFLLMVFLVFFLDPKREVHWLSFVERYLRALGNLESIQVIVALLILLAIQAYVPDEIQAAVMVSGILGIATFVIIHSLTKFVNSFYAKVTHAGFVSFMYLEVLDASFSFDGVIGAFAITKDIVIIMIGLGIGAFFVRSMTIMLVRHKTLQRYVYLEHGAHYALGALAILMLIGIFHHMSEFLIGGIGLGFIVLSYISSVLNNKRQNLDKS